MLVGVVLGAAILALDPERKDVILPFSHLLGDPAERPGRHAAAVSDDGSSPPHAASAKTRSRTSRAMGPRQRRELPREAERDR